MRKSALKIIFLCGLFLLFDRYLKWQALTTWSKPVLANRYFGWLPFSNPGVAFSIPFPNLLVVSVTIPIIIVLVYLLGKQLFSSSHISETKSLATTWALGSILAGSVSNLIDRVWLHHTVDYFLLGTAVINVADILIVVGFVLYFYVMKHKETAI